MTRRRIFVWVGFVLALAALTFTACGANQALSPASSMRYEYSDTLAQATASGFAAPPAQPTSIASNNIPQPQERVILKNASLTITVSDPAAKISGIAAVAESMGGWVVTSSTYATTDSAGEAVTRGSITVRVPAARLNEALERIKAGTEKVEGETINGQDVTQEYVDLSSRLTNLQATERQLQSIMETARKVEDVLVVQRELTTVRGEIETIQGRLNYFDEAAAYSSIAVDVRPPQPGAVESQSAGWNPGETAENALGALIRLAQFAVDTAITLVILVGPFAVVLGIPAWWMWRRRRQNRRAVVS